MAPNRSALTRIEFESVDLSEQVRVVEVATPLKSPLPTQTVSNDDAAQRAASDQYWDWQPDQVAASYWDWPAHAPTVKRPGTAVTPSRTAVISNTTHVVDSASYWDTTTHESEAHDHYWCWTTPTESLPLGTAPRMIPTTMISRTHASVY